MPACVDVVRDLFSAIASVAQDKEAQADLDGLLSDDVVYVEEPLWPGSDTYRGRDDVRSCWTTYRETLGAQMTVEMVDVTELGDEVVAVVRIAGTTDEEVPFDHTWAYRCRCEGGRIAYFRAYMDPEAALAAD